MALRSVREAAAFLGVSVSTLNKWRVYGCGPRYTKMGGAVRYSQADLESFVVAGQRQSTSDTGQAA